MTLTSPPRRFLWVTWLTGLFAGDKQCEWAAWFRGRNRGYLKREDPTSQLSLWKTQHAAMLDEEAKKLEAAGWRVTLENQNKFTLRGEHAIVGGKMDVIARRESTKQVTVVDCKTGEPRDSDFWQVAMYVLAAEHLGLVPPGWTLSGLVCYARPAYKDRAIIAPLHRDHVARIGEVVRRVSAATEPRRAPSFAECRFCDIAACPDRISEEGWQTDTQVF